MPMATGGARLLVPVWALRRPIRTTGLTSQATVEALPKASEVERKNEKLGFKRRGGTPRRGNNPPRTPPTPSTRTACLKWLFNAPDDRAALAHSANRATHRSRIPVSTGFQSPPHDSTPAHLVPFRPTAPPPHFLPPADAINRIWGLPCCVEDLTSDPTSIGFRNNVYEKKRRNAAISGDSTVSGACRGCHVPIRYCHDHGHGHGHGHGHTHPRDAHHHP